MENLTEEAIIEAYMFGLHHHLGNRFVRDRQACGILRECILREYSMTGFDMKGLRSPFADCKVSKDFNKGEYELPQLDAYEYFLTWEDYGSLPDSGMDRYAIACLYPVVRPEWDGQGGFYAIAVAYWDSRKVKKIEPMSDWNSQDVQWITQKKSDIYTQGLAKHQDWVTNPSPYFRGAWARYMVEKWKRRQALDIPLTPWQQSFVDAGGWPSRAEPMEQNLPGAIGEQAAASALQEGAKDGDFLADTAGGDSGSGSGVDEEQARQASVEGGKKEDKIDSDGLGEFVAELVAHCKKHRDKFTFESNPDHHFRWNRAIALVEDRQFNDALDYADAWVQKGWKPWQEFVNMIND